MVLFMVHKILVSAPVPLELILPGFDWVGAGPLGFGTGLDNYLYLSYILSVLVSFQFLRILVN